MDSLYKWSDAEIEKLGKDVHYQLKENILQEDLSLDLLRRICGKSECDCMDLTPARKLSRLIKLMHNNITDYSVGSSVIINYNTLASEKHCQTALETVLTWSLSDPNSHSKYHFLDQLWSFQGLKTFKINALEEFLCKETKYIEEDIFKMFEELLSLGKLPEHLWEEDRFSRLVSWSCESGKIFCVVASVLNSWMLRIVKSTNQYKSSLSVINMFIRKVKQRCANSNKDFVVLYPREYHSSVSLLDIELEVVPKQAVNVTSVSQSTVVEFVTKSFYTRPLQTVCILTHFPEWAKLLYTTHIANYKCP